MNNCVGNIPIEGGTFRDSIFMNPTIYGGSATDLNLKSPVITGGINMDEITAAALIELLCSRIKGCVGGTGGIEVDADKITGITWDANQTTLIVEVENVDGTPNSFPISFTQFTKKIIGNGVAPNTTDGNDVSNVYYGNRNYTLGGPVKWQMNEDGTVTPRYLPGS